MKKFVYSMVILATLLALTFVPTVAAPSKIGINVVLTGPLTADIRADLGKYGRIAKEIPALNALTMKVDVDTLATIQALPYVEAANPDAERNAVPIDTVSATNFANGINLWNLDSVNVTQPFNKRTVAYDGTDVIVAVLDTGLVDAWRSYFPQERILVEYAKSFAGGGGEVGNVSEQPNKWEHDQNSHGTHVTSTIIGFQAGPNKFNGVAPLVKVIPVKVLNQNGSGWSSVIAEGITYIADLKKGPLADYPIVINMSLGGSVLDAIEKEAIDYAIDAGVLIVASAGNSGTKGMGYPGAYEPVISVAASGWIGQWTAGNWFLLDVPDPTNPADFFIADFSSRALEGQDLDVTAPGAAVLGPYKVNSGNELTYYYLSGTSMASPHVAGIVALMAQKNPGLTNPVAEGILESTAIYMEPGCRDILARPGTPGTVCWGADATGAGLTTADAALAATP